MRRVLACVVACLVGLQPAVVLGAAGRRARTAASQAQLPPAPGAASEAVPSIDSLGLSFDRIKRGLRILPPSDRQHAAQAGVLRRSPGRWRPPIPIFKPGELTTGPVPYGAPTHSDMMSHVTPEEFKSPRIPVSGIVIMGIVKLIQWEAAPRAGRADGEGAPGGDRESSASASAA